jgi:hypothetical protein
VATGTISSFDYPNWQLISTVTPTAGTALTNFTGLSGYNSYKIVLKQIGFSSTCYGWIYFNDDQTQYNYNSFGTYYNQSGNATQLFGGSNDANMRIFGPAGGNQFTGTIDITNANQTIVPTEIKTNVSSANYPSLLEGTWIKATPETISKITIEWSANYNGNGSFKLYGLA